MMSQDRALDPLRINLYIYTRNNPRNFTDTFGEDIEEPTGLNEEAQAVIADGQKKIERDTGCILSFNFSITRSPVKNC